MPFTPVPNISHVDSVGTVQTVVGAVTAAGGTIDTVAEVQNVVNAVMAAGGTIDTVAEVQAVVNAVQAAGGHVDSVQTVIDAVQAAGGTIDAVAGSSIGAPIPYYGVDALAWPQISGQPYAPTVAAGTYGATLGLPAIALSSGGSATFPYIPRTSGDKDTITYRGSYSTDPSSNSANPLAETLIIGAFAGASGSVLGGIGVHAATGLNRQLFFDAVDASGNVLATLTSITRAQKNTFNSWSIVLHADGSVTFTVNGASYTSAAGLASATTNTRVSFNSWGGSTDWHGPLFATYSS